MRDPVRPHAWTPDDADVEERCDRVAIGLFIGCLIVFAILALLPILLDLGTSHAPAAVPASRRDGR